MRFKTEIASQEKTMCSFHAARKHANADCFAFQHVVKSTSITDQLSLNGR